MNKLTKKTIRPIQKELIVNKILKKKLKKNKK